MKIITLQVNDSVKDKFFKLLEDFSPDEVKILGQSDEANADEYLQSIDKMVQSVMEVSLLNNDK
ncbi:hypothetical protein [Candidatus Venteria ishoeyi]|uniref:Uncharacterized protein n=1 Tax=Candidatus Venteria ishoeyi TaxID=1899563 RepID=A0A1H6FDK2_9GAMM|nr:hypothetical protein [Candidatus Venteria ishoeyi]SEH08127.1 Uncharacterised protein [Candidatus Venteria ishoeyi]